MVSDDQTQQQNPLTNLTPDSLVQIYERHSEALAHEQAKHIVNELERVIRTSAMMNEKLRDSYVIYLPATDSAGLYNKNKELLLKNGFFVWVIRLLRKEMVWDPEWCHRLVISKKDISDEDFELFFHLYVNNEKKVLNSDYTKCKLDIDMQQHLKV